MQRSIYRAALSAVLLLAVAPAARSCGSEPSVVAACRGAEAAEAVAAHEVGCVEEGCCAVQPARLAAAEGHGIVVRRRGAEPTHPGSFERPETGLLATRGGPPGPGPRSSLGRYLLYAQFLL